MKAKTILPIAVIALLLAVPLVTATSSIEAEPNDPEASPVIGKISIMVVPDNIKNAKFEEFEVTEEDVANIEGVLEKLWAWTKAEKPFRSIEWENGKMVILSQEEKDVLEEYLNDLKEAIGAIGFFGLLDIVPFIIPAGLRKNIVCSIGWGKALMPFSKYEAGLRLIIPFIRPIRLLQFRGHTGYWNFIPGVQYGDKSHFHLVTARLFQGVYIDGGALLTERWMGGPTLALGRGLVSVWGIR